MKTLLQQLLDDLFEGYLSRNRKYIIAKLIDLSVTKPQYKLPKDPEKALEVLIDKGIAKLIANGEHVERTKFFT